MRFQISMAIFSSVGFGTLRFFRIEQLLEGKDRIDHRPELTRPLLVAAFRGWNDIWLDPAAHYNDAVGGSYQLMQGLFGMGSGGLLGKEA